MLWVTTLSVFLPSLLISCVVCPSASVGGSAKKAASSQGFRMIVLPWRAVCPSRLRCGDTARFRAPCLPCHGLGSVWCASRRLLRQARFESIVSLQAGGPAVTGASCGSDDAAAHSRREC